VQVRGDGAGKQVVALAPLAHIEEHLDTVADTGQ
jgi:hypothetical protein